MAREEETRKEAGTVRRQLLFEEELCEPIDIIQSDDDDKDMVEEGEDNTDSEQSADEGQDTASGPFYTGKDGESNWNIRCTPRNRRVGEHNLVTF